ncbi:MAG: hypothetical protein KJZ97_07230 [Burkholderiaceae bacterium]|nr:hypothetical protein [Burkholderiaceae bacterium]
MRTNYVLIDYENVQPTAISVLDAEHFRVHVFVGPGQSRVSFEIASTLQRMGPRAEYIRVSAPGKNALDFHIAFQLGQLALREPDRACPSRWRSARRWWSRTSSSAGPPCREASRP